MERPNILLLVIDCLRADRLLGAGRSARTPNLDRLAAAGVTCDSLIVETPSTTPSFASLLTGTYSTRHGVVGVGGYRLARELPTVAERLRAAGYATWAEATGPLVPAAELARGFETYNYRVALDDLRGPWGRRLIEMLRQERIGRPGGPAGGRRSDGEPPRPWFLLVHLWELHVVRCVPPAFDRPEFGADAYDRALSALDDALGELLAAVPAGTTILVTGDHGEKTAREAYQPGSAVDEIRRRYGLDAAGGFGVRAVARLLGPVAMHQLRERFQPRLEAFTLGDGAVTGGASLRDLLAVLRVSPWAGPRGWALLMRGRGAISAALAGGGWLDARRSSERIERLVRKMGELRVFELYLRMWRAQARKQLDEGHVLHLYDWLVRVPLIVRASGPVAGGRCGRMVRQVDLAATILALAGAAPADGAFGDGRSLLPLLAGGESGERPAAFLSVRGQPRDACLRGVRTEHQKLTYGAEGSGLPDELYDLRDDPGELRNIAGERPEEVARLRALAEEMIPEGGPRTERAAELPAAEQALLESRLRELGYVE